MPSILDAFPYPWPIPDAQHLHTDLAQIHPTSKAALLVAAKASIQTNEIYDSQAPSPLWQDILKEAATQGRTRVLVQLVHDGLNAKSPYRPFLAQLLANEAGTFEPPAAAADDTPLAERVQLTSVRCRLAGANVLAEQVGADAATGLLTAFKDHCRLLFGSLSGLFAEGTGGNVLVYFWRHEDVLQGVLRGALDLTAEFDEFVRANRETFYRAPAPAAAPPGGVALRVAVHTEMTVVTRTGGEAPRDEPFVAAHISALLNALLDVPGKDGVYLSGATAKLAERRFECENSGHDVAAGPGGLTHAYRLVAERDPLLRFVPGRLTEFVGKDRAAAVDQLASLWGRARAGETQVVFLTGDAGVGKSRILYELRERIKAERPIVRAWQCWEQYQSTALYPIADLVVRTFELDRKAPPDEQLARLKRRLAEDRITLLQAVPALAALVSLPLPSDGRYPPLGATPQERREASFRVLVDILGALAGRRPVLLVGEDLHWTDPSTLELLDKVITNVKEARALIVLTFRPKEFSHPWPHHDNQTEIRLKPLDAVDAKEMIMKVPGGSGLQAAAVAAVAERANGYPLYVEELTKTAVESKGADPGAIPPPLVPPLKARLDRLGPSAKQTARIASVIGREFSFELLQAVSGVTEKTLRGRLDRLVGAEIIYPRGQPGDRYWFKHALLRDAALDTLAPQERRELHLRIAEELEKAGGAPPPELLADHLTQAGLLVRAVPYWQQAGDAAVKRSANVEAIALFEKGIEAVAKLPAGTDRDPKEFALRFGQAAPTIVTAGYGSDKLEAVYKESRALAERLGDRLKLFQVLRGLWVYHIARAQFADAVSLAKELAQIADAQAQSGLHVEANFTLGVPELYLGRPAETASFMQKAIDRYDPEAHKQNKYLYGHDPGVAAGGFAGWSLTVLGHYQEGLERIAASLALAEEIEHPFSLSYANYFAALVHHLRVDIDQADKAAQTCMALCTKQGFSVWGAGSQVYCGWVMVQRGQFDKGLRWMAEGFRKWIDTGSLVAQTHWACFRAEACDLAGKPAEGLALLEEGFKAAADYKEVLYLPELHRLKAALTLRVHPGPQAEQEAAYHLGEAVATAHGHGSTYFEVRARRALAEVHRRAGRTAEARAVLEAVHPALTAPAAPRDVAEALKLMTDLRD
jgi:predicted ATPase/class 3 adenylate cyclase